MKTSFTDPRGGLNWFAPYSFNFYSVLATSALTLSEGLVNGVASLTKRSRGCDTAVENRVINNVRRA